MWPLCGHYQTYANKKKAVVISMKIFNLINRYIKCALE